MAESKLKKPGKVGNKKSWMGMGFAIAILLITFGSVFGMKDGLPGLLKMIGTFAQMNPVFAGSIAICAYFGGDAFAKFLNGGTKLGDTSQISDLEKL